MRTLPKIVLSAAAVAVGAMALLPVPASAHADADVIAVAAGEQVTINFRPNHGCGASATNEVAVRVPVAGATGGAVEGWDAPTATEDGDGRTVVEWTGGSLPTEVTGAFPVTFTAPDKVGELLLFPSVQGCENGEELSWLNGDPESDNPSPRLLILAPGSPKAVSIDDVPQDAPGRELITAVIDTAPSTTTTVAPTTTAPAETTTSTKTTVASSEGSEPAPADSSSGGSNAIAIILVGGVALAMLGGGLYLWRKEK
jgi:uncharacterized protein YcnI